ncbi:MAG: hypothetical protein K2X03_26690 [Bryobacteraceae bacterium]|nr:hypothetical protein [Bryobacteraceae bacterium]
MRALILLLLAAVPLWPADAVSKAASLAAQVREISLDPDRCYRVRDVKLDREDIKLFFTEGLIIFSKPIEGAPLAAIFSAQVDSGEAEVLLMPPTRGERGALAHFTKSPNLASRFENMLMLFTDGTAADLMRQLEASPGGLKPAVEMGLVLRQRYEASVRNVAESMELRLVQDLLAGRPADRSLFYAILSGSPLGNFDLLVDGRDQARVVVGQFVTREAGRFFDVWCSFTGKSRRALQGPAKPAGLRIDAVKLDVRVAADLKTRVATRLTVLPRDSGEPAIPFDISPRMRIQQVRVNGEPAEFLQRDSIRAGLFRAEQNETFLVLPAKPLEAGRAYEIEFEQEGEVIREAGNGVYFMAARTNWYPQRGLQFARHEATFRYPAALTLVSAGDLVESKLEGDTRIDSWKTAAPVRLLGFNLGRFTRNRQSRGVYHLDVYANEKLETGLSAPPVLFAPPQQPQFGRPRRPDLPVMSPTIQPSPADRLSTLGADLMDALDFMSARFGAPPLTSLNVTPIPGRFGQGFPGLIYLSTLNYLEERRATDVGPFFNELLQSHEIAHQWWGNSVTPARSEDDWLMEALANYSSLLYLEKRRGPKAVDVVLETFRDRLLKTNEKGETVESTGPIVWGFRLQNSQSPGAWQSITYEKGAWILHMLRRRMGDPAFLKLLAELERRYHLTPVSTEDVERLAVEVMGEGGKKALGPFFESWVYGTGVPTLQMTQSVKGLVVTGTVKQTGTDDDFSIDVPIEIQLRTGKPVIHWVRTSSEPVEFTVKLPAPATKVSLDPGHAVLRH